jgi:hypothetical protein
MEEKNLDDLIQEAKARQERIEMDEAWQEVEAEVADLKRGFARHEINDQVKASIKADEGYFTTS